MPANHLHNNMVSVDDHPEMVAQYIKDELARGQVVRLEMKLDKPHLNRPEMFAFIAHHNLAVTELPSKNLSLKAF